MGPELTEELSFAGGGLVELHAVFFILGFAVASWVGFGFSFWTTSGDAWRPPLAIQAFWSLLGLIALYWIPESPRWLVMKDREEEAQAILFRLHSDPSDSEHEFARAEMYQIQKQIRVDRTLGNSWKRMFTKRSYLKRVAMACGLTFFIQSSGDLVINSTYPTTNNFVHDAIRLTLCRLQSIALQESRLRRGEATVISISLADIHFGTEVCMKSTLLQSSHRSLADM